MGLSNVATGSSTVFAVMTGGLILDLVNNVFGLGTGPRAAYLLGAVYYVVAMICLRPVVEPDRGAEPARPSEPARRLTAGRDPAPSRPRRSSGEPWGRPSHAAPVASATDARAEPLEPRSPPAGRSQPNGSGRRHSTGTSAHRKTM